MRPHFAGIVLRDSTNNIQNNYILRKGPGVVLRFARTLSKPPRFTLEEYLSYVVIRLCEVFINSLKRGESSEVFDKLIESCLYVEGIRRAGIQHPSGSFLAKFHSLPTNISRIFVDRCFLPSHKNHKESGSAVVRSDNGSYSLYDLHQEYWNILMTAWLRNQLRHRGEERKLEFKVESTLAGILDRGNDVVEGLFNLYNLILYSLYIRELNIISPSLDSDDRHVEPVSIVFSFRDIIDSLISQSHKLNKWERDVLGIMLSIYGSYSAIGQYAMIQWYSRIYGAGISPSTIKAFEIEYLKRNNKGILEPFLRGESGFGKPWEPTLVRYLHRLDLDTIHLAASIDTYVSKVYHNAWIRSGVLTSFIRSLAQSIGEHLDKNNTPPHRIPKWLGKPEINRENLLVLPIPEPPENLAEPFSTIRAVSLVKIPYRISPRITELITDTLVHLSEKGVSSEQLNRIAAKIRDLLINESRQIEKTQIENYESFMKNNPELFSSCVKGFLVEVLHPVEEFILLSKAITRKVAEYPSRTGKEFAIEVLMKRLTESRQFIVIPYVIVDGASLYKDIARLRSLASMYQEGLKSVNARSDELIKRIYIVEKLSLYSKIVNNFNNNRSTPTINLERVLMAVNDYQWIDELIGKSNSRERLRCLETLNAISWGIAQER